MKKLIKLILIFFLPAFSLAQEKGALTKDVVDTALKHGHQNIKQTLYSPSDKSTILNPVSNFSISSEFQKGTSGKVDLRLPLDKSEWIQLNISAKQKITEGTTEATPFNIHGISPNSTISIGFQSMFWRPKPSGSAFAEFYQEIGKDFLKRHGRPENEINSLMKGEFDEEALNKLGARTIRQPLFFNINFSFSKNTFNYTTDSIKLNNFNENKISTSISASVIKVLSIKALQQVISINFNYEDYYKGGDPNNFLMKFGSTTNYISNNIAFGSPKHIFDKLFSLEYKLGKTKDSSNVFLFGLAPSITYSFEQKNLAFQVPVYFVPNKDEKGNPKGLTGGISLGYLTSTDGNWSSFNKGFAFELFIGLPFNILK